MQRWGASTVCLKTDKADDAYSMFCFGGYGLDETNRTSYKRLNSMMKCTNTKWEQMQFRNDAPEPRIYQTMNKYETKEGTKLVVFGGRSNPMSAFNDIWICTPETNSWEQYNATNQDEAPKTFRHSTVIFDDALVVFGGIHVHNQETISLSNDIFVHDFRTSTWHTVKSINAPSPRHSHAAKVVANTMYITGGQIESEANGFIDATILYSCDLNELLKSMRSEMETKAIWEEKALKSAHGLGLYSHTAHVVSGGVDNTPFIILLGGIIIQSGKPKECTMDENGIAHVIDLEKGTCSLLKVDKEPSCENMNALLTRHTSCVIPDGDSKWKVFCIGGGLNCFSFGSFFSPLLIFDLSFNNNSNVFSLKYKNLINQVQEKKKSKKESKKKVQYDPFRVDILKAKGVLKKNSHVLRTPLLSLPILGNSIVFKLETCQTMGSFKIRGMVNLFHAHEKQMKEYGAITFSAGNAGRSFAYLCQQLNIKPSYVCMPDNTSQDRIDSIKQFGATVILAKRDKLLSTVQEYIDEKNVVLVKPFDDLDLMAGYGSIGLEILKDCPDVTTILVGCGGGGLVAGISAAVRLCDKRKNKVRVIGVEPELANSMYLSFEQGKAVTLCDQKTTIAGGLAPPFSGTHCYEICKKYVQEIVLVNENELLDTTRFLYSNGLVVEPAGCASLAALRHNKIKIEPNEKVVCILSGGNISPTILSKLFQ